MLYLYLNINQGFLREETNTDQQTYSEKNLRQTDEKAMCQLRFAWFLCVLLLIYIYISSQMLVEHDGKSLQRDSNHLLDERNR